jgi:hypothetical protein
VRNPNHPSSGHRPRYAHPLCKGGLVIQRSPINMLAICAMIGMTVWNGRDGGRSWLLIGIASIGVVATFMILRTLAYNAPQTRLIQSMISASWVFLFLPAWDWLAGLYLFPDTIYRTIIIGIGYGLITFFYIRRPGRPQV